MLRFTCEQCEKENEDIIFVMVEDICVTYIILMPLNLTRVARISDGYEVQCTRGGIS